MENIGESKLSDLIINHKPSNELLKAAGRVPEKKGFNDEQTLQPLVLKSSLKKKPNFVIAFAAIAIFLILKK